MHPDEPALIVAPSSLLTNWAKEIARFAPSLTVSSYYGADRSGLSDPADDGQPPIKKRRKSVVCGHLRTHIVTIQR